MAQTSSVILTSADRERLAAIVAERKRPQKHVQRARIILYSDERLPVLEVARRAGVSRPAVWRWQQRFAEEGIAGLLRDKTRPPGKAPLPPETIAKVLAITCSEPPGEVTHWTGRAVAALVGIALRTVQRIWDAHRLQPHRVRTFKRSNDPAFAEKVEDIVGLYMSPPAHAVVLSIDEKSQIPALRRTRPSTPVRPGHPATMPHDYERHGTTTLFAALTVLDGTVLGRCMQRHRHQAFIRFLNAVEASVPAGKVVHVILDNYAAHKHPKAPQSAHLAGPSPALGVPLHPDFRLVDQRRGGLLFGPDATTAEARRLHLRCRSPSRHQALHRQAQRQPTAVHLD
jgi:transposase